MNIKLLVEIIGDCFDVSSVIGLAPHHTISTPNVVMMMLIINC